MKNKNKKSGIKTQKINSEAIVKYTMQSNLLQNLILNLDEDLKNQNKLKLSTMNLLKVLHWTKLHSLESHQLENIHNLLGKLLIIEK